MRKRSWSLEALVYGLFRSMRSTQTGYFNLESDSQTFTSDLMSMRQVIRSPPARSERHALPGVNGERSALRQSQMAETIAPRGPAMSLVFLFRLPSAYTSRCKPYLPLAVLSAEPAGDLNPQVSAPCRAHTHTNERARRLSRGIIKCSWQAKRLLAATQDQSKSTKTK